MDELKTSKNRKRPPAALFRITLCILIAIVLIFIASTLPLRNKNPIRQIPITKRTCEKPPAHPLRRPAKTKARFLQHYIQTHQTKYRCLVSPTCTRQPRTLIWTCPAHDSSRCAGAGDRLRGILFAALLAAATDRLFLLSWPDVPHTLLAALEPNEIDWRVPPAILETYDQWPLLKWYQCEGSAKKIRNCTFGGHLPEMTELPNFNDSAKDINLYTDDIPTIISEHDNITINTRPELMVIPDFLRNPYIAKRLGTFHGSDILALQREVMNALFRPTRQVAAIMRKTGFAGKPYLGIHARTGMDVAETSDGRFTYVNNHINESVQLILDCAVKSEGGSVPKRVYVAADSQVIKQEIAREGAQRGISVKYIADKAWHTALGMVRTDVSKVGEDKICVMFLNVYAELMSLSKSKKIITTGSGYASSAFLLGQASSFAEINLGAPLDEQCNPPLDDDDNAAPFSYKNSTVTEGE